MEAEPHTGEPGKEEVFITYVVKICDIKKNGASYRDLLI